MRIIPTANFERNLESIEAFLAERDESSWFESLLDRLFDEAIPNLQKFPDMGRNFLAGEPLSVEGKHLYAEVCKKVGAGDVREYIFGQYLLLYLRKEDAVYLLSIKHHAQLSFDLSGHWA